MCGKEAELFKAIVEGTELSVCKGCTRFGKVIRPIKQNFQPKPRIEKQIEIVQKEETEEMVIEDYANTLKQQREKKGFTQQDLAKRLNEKESLLQKVESGHVKPSLRLAKKLQNFLKVKFIEEVKTNKHVISKKEASGPLTIGDLITIKRK